MNTIKRELPNFKHLTNNDGKIYGIHNTVTSINPYKCHFVATYPNGIEVNGINLFTTGWDQIPQGLLKLRYELSTGHIIEIPKYKAYLPTIEVSIGMEGSKIFHFINVDCLAEKEIIVYKIVLKQGQISKFSIGDVILSKKRLPLVMVKSWKYTS